MTGMLLGCGNPHQKCVGPPRVALKLQPFRLALAWETSVELMGDLHLMGTSLCFYGKL